MKPKSVEGPHTTRRLGSLKNGNRPGDPNAAPRCGAKTREAASCQAPAMPNGRCRLHGGKSTGPRTADGLERCRTANWKHGRYSREACAERRGLREMLPECGKFLKRLQGLT